MSVKGDFQTEESTLSTSGAYIYIQRHYGSKFICPHIQVERNNQFLRYRTRSVGYTMLQSICMRKSLILLVGEGFSTTGYKHTRSLYFSSDYNGLCTLTLHTIKLGGMNQLSLQMPLEKLQVIAAPVNITHLHDSLG